MVLIQEPEVMVGAVSAVLGILFILVVTVVGVVMIKRTEPLIDRAVARVRNRKSDDPYGHIPPAPKDTVD